MYDFPKPDPKLTPLKQLTGTWESHVKFYFQPDAPPQESKGEYIAEMDLGGYFLTRDIDINGLKFQGRGMTGYDPYKNTYAGVWLDSGSPAVYLTEGSFDESGKIFTEISQGPDSQGQPLTMVMTTEIQDEDHLIFKMSQRNENGQETLITEMAHTRRK